jgi:uncharacterized protein YbjT (DUF2867 family)
MADAKEQPATTDGSGVADGRRIVLVSGATGNQGGATVEQLLASGRVRVRVLTRNPSSPKASALRDRGVQVVQGDFDDANSLRAALDGASGVFSVQSFFDGGAEAEERRGKAFADAAKAAGVEHLVYTSVDGAERQSGVPHFESKWRIEEHVRNLGLRSTILRPVAFMDMFGGSAMARAVFWGVLRAVLGNSKRLQIIATRDIGWFAARALEEPEKFAGRAIALAGDELTVPEMAETYKRATGGGTVRVPVPRVLLRIMPKEMSSMLYWFGEHGYRADIEALRREHPGLSTFEQWLKDARRAK